VLAAFPGAAHAVPIAVDHVCHGRNIENSGATGTPVLPTDDPFPLQVPVGTVSAPTEVNAGASFDGVQASISIPVPSQVVTGIQGIGIEGSGVVNVNAAANIIQTIQIDGAAAIGTPTITGGGAIGPSVSKPAANQVAVKLPGTQNATDPNFLVPPANTDHIPGIDKEFPAGSTFASPTLTIPVTAGAAGTTITFKYVKLQADSSADAFDNPAQPIPIRAFCDPTVTVLGSVQVVAPPPPGAPDAKADSVSTNAGTAVKIDVLGNDTPDSGGLPIDQNSLAITANASKGTAVLNADHTVTYTPNAGASGTDTFTYKLCSKLPEPTTTTTTTQVELKVPEAIVLPQGAPCDEAIVTVNIIVPVTPTTLRAATAAAPPAALPKTGSSSLPLGAIGMMCAVLGAAALGATRRLRHQV
jgi:LPXTG-motif cell wall-anchored protein